MAASNYDDKNITTLDWVEHIRKRPGMYIGDIGNGSGYHDCVYILMKEVIDNAVDEFVMGYGRQVDVTVNFETGETTVRDYGRGIPLGKVVECVSEMNTGGKFDSDAFQFSAGMNGVGTKAVNALSSEFEVRAFREGEFSEAFFREGKLVSKKRGRCKEPGVRNGTYVRYVPDADQPQRQEDPVLRRPRRPHRRRGAVREALPAVPLPHEDDGDHLHPHEPLLRGVLHVRERTVHHRGRHPPHRLQGGPHQGDQRLRRQEEVRRRRRARGPARVRGDPHEGPRVRRADEDEARQRRAPQRVRGADEEGHRGDAPPRPRRDRQAHRQDRGDHEAPQPAQHDQEAEPRARGRRLRARAAAQGLQGSTRRATRRAGARTR